MTKVKRIINGECHFEMTELADCIGIHVNELWNILFEKINFGIRFRMGDK